MHLGALCHPGLEKQHNGPGPHRFERPECSGAWSGPGDREERPGAVAGPAGEPSLIGPPRSPGRTWSALAAGPPAPARRREALTTGLRSTCDGGREQSGKRSSAAYSGTRSGWNLAEVLDLRAGTGAWVFILHVRVCACSGPVIKLSIYSSYFVPEDLFQRSYSLPPSTFYGTRSGAESRRIEEAPESRKDRGGTDGLTRHFSEEILCLKARAGSFAGPLFRSASRAGREHYIEAVHAASALVRVSSVTHTGNPHQRLPGYLLLRV
ncbi:hypothetical protein NDU88_004814 [Pleurodeles waltl]|uniref:Uncharacterized protein n=1 Tax=Pleurodeles waltl TaxID=8319 RepID=A0AAV7MAA7_PLEWA|nr:hypothetical protein NDU88_004814 [Pleurodeles waltl]